MVVCTGSILGAVQEEHQVADLASKLVKLEAKRASDYGHIKSAQEAVQRLEAVKSAAAAVEEMKESAEQAMGAVLEAKNMLSAASVKHGTGTKSMNWPSNRKKEAVALEKTAGNLAGISTKLETSMEEFEEALETLEQIDTESAGLATKPEATSPAPLDVDSGAVLARADEPVARDDAPRPPPGTVVHGPPVSAAPSASSPHLVEHGAPPVGEEGSAAATSPPPDAEWKPPPTAVTPTGKDAEKKAAALAEVFADTEALKNTTMLAARRTAAAVTLAGEVTMEMAGTLTSHRYRSYSTRAAERVATVEAALESTVDAAKAVNETLAELVRTEKERLAEAVNLLQDATSIAAAAPEVAPLLESALVVKDHPASNATVTGGEVPAAGAEESIVVEINTTQALLAATRVKQEVERNLEDEYERKTSKAAPKVLTRAEEVARELAALKGVSSAADEDAFAFSTAVAAPERPAVNATGANATSTAEEGDNDESPQSGFASVEAIAEDVAEAISRLVSSDSSVWGAGGGEEDE